MFAFGLVKCFFIFFCKKICFTQKKHRFTQNTLFFAEKKLL